MEEKVTLNKYEILKIYYKLSSNVKFGLDQSIINIMQKTGLNDDDAVELLAKTAMWMVRIEKGEKNE